MIENKKYDLVIVGAGPAGCTVANFLYKDYKTLLLDRSDFPRNKPCGGILVPESQKFLGKKIPKNVFSKPKYFNLNHVDWNNELEIKDSRKMFNISRKRFDYWIFKIIKNKVDFLSKTELLKWRRKGSGLDIFIEKDGKKRMVQAKYLICATGTFLPIREKFTNRKIKYFIATQYWLKPKKKINCPPYFIYDNNITDLYSWVIPKDKYVLVGSALESKDIEKKMEELIEKVGGKLKIAGNITKKEGAMGFQPRSTKDIVLGKDRVLLVGEAAGFISPSTGEGISFALRSGYNCAKALNEDFKDALKGYRNLCRPLVEEIEDKIKKAKLLFEPRKRKNIFLYYKKKFKQ